MRGLVHAYTGDLFHQKGLKNGAFTSFPVLHFESWDYPPRSHQKTLTHC